MRKNFTKIRRFLKRYKVIIILSAVIFVFPLVVGLIYYIPLPQIINIDSGDLISYYATVFGIFGSFVALLYEKQKAEQKRRSDNKPSFAVDVIKENDDVFWLKIKKISKKPLFYFYLYDKYVSQEFDENFVLKISYCKSVEDKATLGIDYNIDYDIIDEKDGYPKYIQIMCDDVDKKTWDCCYHKVNNCGKIYYYPEEFLII